MYNLEAIAASLGFEPKDVQMIVSVLLEDAEVSIEKISQMYEKEAWPQIGVEAHAIKGSAANMKLHELSQLSKALEEAAQQKDVKQVSMLIKKIQQELVSLRQALEV